jgi:hypothetical protein
MRAFLRRLETGGCGWRMELGFRLSGVLLLAACAFAAWTLSLSLHRSSHHTVAPAEFGEAMFSVAAWALGWALLAEGPGLFRLCEIPARHARLDRHQ